MVLGSLVGPESTVNVEIPNNTIIPTGLAKFGDNLNTKKNGGKGFYFSLKEKNPQICSDAQRGVTSDMLLYQNRMLTN